MLNDMIVRCPHRCVLIDVPSVSEFSPLLCSVSVHGASSRIPTSPSSTPGPMALRAPSTSASCRHTPHSPHSEANHMPLKPCHPSLLPLPRLLLHGIQQLRKLLYGAHRVSWAAQTMKVPNKSTRQFRNILCRCAERAPNAGPRGGGIFLYAGVHVLFPAPGVGLCRPPLVLRPHD